MNGRLERMDGRLEIFSEHNYAAIDFFFSEERRRRLKRIAKDVVLLGILWGSVCLIIWGVAKSL